MGGVIWVLDDPFGLFRNMMVDYDFFLYISLSGSLVKDLTSSLGFVELQGPGTIADN